jgi:hypothetical protein
MTGQGCSSTLSLLDDAASAVQLADDDVEILAPPSTSFGLSRAAASQSGKSAKQPPLTAAQASAVGQARLLGTSDDEDDAFTRGGSGRGSGVGAGQIEHGSGSPAWFDHDADYDAGGGNLDSDDDGAPSGTEGKGDLKSETKSSQRGRGRGGGARGGRGGTGSRRPPPPPPPGQQQQQRADQQLYWPEHIIAKKTVRWKNLYLIHWRGFGESERTWEPADFFDEYCTLQTTAYERKRVPVRVVSERTRNRPAFRTSASAGASGAGAGAGSGLAQSHSQSQSQTVLVYYELEWQGQRETSLELASDLARAPQGLADSRSAATGAQSQAQR